MPWQEVTSLNGEAISSIINDSSQHTTCLALLQSSPTSELPTPQTPHPWGKCSDQLHGPTRKRRHKWLKELTKIPQLLRKRAGIWTSFTWLPGTCFATVVKLYKRYRTNISPLSASGTCQSLSKVPWRRKSQVTWLVTTMTRKVMSRNFLKISLHLQFIKYAHLSFL